MIASVTARQRRRTLRTGGPVVGLPVECVQEERCELRGLAPGIGANVARTMHAATRVSDLASFAGLCLRCVVCAR
eukprot:13631970-Alexandrium_andersonii.AAC.1